MKAFVDEPYQNFRSVVFRTSRTEYGLPKMAEATQPWAVLVEWGLRERAAAVVALCDGTVWVHLGCGGCISDNASLSVRKAAKEMVAIATAYRPRTYLATNFPTPRLGRATFYFLTDAGVFAAAGDYAELGPLSRLGDAARRMLMTSRPAKG